ncbi:MAG TPA: VWA domain-containing protein [Terriglobales bacterium]|nr:VWA domain-containing protein [Terriglobales bacterium]
MLLLLPFTLFWGRAASASPPQQAGVPVATFHANSRLVQVDVVVLDAAGHPVLGLKPSDFHVLEDGKPQQIAAFDAHLQKPAIDPPHPFHLPPNQYTNVPEEDSSAPLAVVLFDTLNTAAGDQVYARQQMLEFLKSLPAGERIALFALGTRLRMIQTFTGKSDVLIAASTRLLASPSAFVRTEAEQQRQEDDLIYRERMVAPTTGGVLSGGVQLPNATSIAPLAVATQKLRDALTEQQQAAISERVGTTLEALAELSVMMRGFQGRKNLLWLSGGFPFGFGPNPFERSDLRNTGHFDAPVRQTEALLAAAQVAVYPIDVGGVHTQGTDLSSTGEGTSGVDAQTGISRLNTAFARQLQQETDAHATMDDIADQTGGKAFYGSNDVRDALQRGLVQGSSYYSLSYIPENTAWNGKFRRIQVKLLRGGYRLQYRRGYYAIPETERTAQDSNVKLVAALRPDMPDSTSLFIKALILPPDAGHKSLRVTYLIDPQQVTFSDMPNGRKHALVDLLAIVWDKNGKDVGHAADTIDATLDQAAYQNVLHSGLQASQEIAVQPGAYRVRIGAVDRASQQVGTIDAVLAQ